jgi:hypothetical protein
VDESEGSRGLPVAVGAGARRVAGVRKGEIDGTGDPDVDADLVTVFLKRHGLYRGAPTTAQMVFLQAAAFCRTAATLHENLSGPDRNPLNVPPFVVNSAFSIEMYLLPRSRESARLTFRL